MANQTPQKEQAPRKENDKHPMQRGSKPDDMKGDGNQDVLPGEYGNDSLPGNKKKPQPDKLQ